MTYLEFANIAKRNITDDIVIDFIKFALTDKRVNDIRYLGLNSDDAHIFKIDSDLKDFKNKPELTLGQIAGILHENSEQRRFRLARERQLEQERIENIESAYKTRLSKFVEIAKKNKASLRDLEFYHDVIFSGRSAKFTAKSWLRAEKTIEEFNSFEKIKNCADFNFFRQAYKDIAKELDL